MVKILEVGETKRVKEYFKAICPWCGAKLAFERNDVWIDDPMNGIGRIECPMYMCRQKIHVRIEVPIAPVEFTDKSVFDNAIKDSSKRGIMELFEKKAKEDVIKNDIYNQLAENEKIRQEVKLKYPFGNQNS